MDSYENRTNKDWSFSNMVHQQAIESIYKTTFFPKNTNLNITKATNKEDMEEGIDYWLEYDNNRIAIQERFRTKNKYTIDSYEFTLRYKRPNSISINQKESEFFKIKAQWLLYGITNNENTNFTTNIDFRRFVFIDLDELMRAINDKKIMIDLNENNKRYFPYKLNNQIFAIVKNNHEQGNGNSQLVIFDIKLLQNLKEYKIVLSQLGYLNNEKKHNNYLTP